MIYLDKEDIILINERTIAAHGGNFTPPFNILKEESLDYVVDIVQSEMFGEPMYPQLSDKAAVYLFNIVCNHIFLDGNKRTGLEVASAFLKFNGWRLSRDLPKPELLNFVIKVASGESTLDECRAWFKENITPI
jgi:death on curing protein